MKVLTISYVRPIKWLMYVVMVVVCYKPNSRVIIFIRHNCMCLIFHWNVESSHMLSLHSAP